ncbi:MAG: GNAT family N-acetyltransferase [Ignavibacteria bacterium]|nr:GNAT family N-acetyltransferase [Ignavibacteria bacterium]
MEVIRVNINSSIEWRDFLSHNYHMFYDYNFLAYNDVFDKNINWHHLIFKKNNKITALLTGNERVTEEGKTFVSTDGVSFGGFLWKDKVKIFDYIKCVSEFKNYLGNNGFNRCLIRNAPSLYLKNPNEEYEYALLLEGFNVSKYAITNIVDLNLFEFEKLKNPKKRSIQKSEKNIQLELIEEDVDIESLSDFYRILFENRKLKDVKPTHTIEELVFLKNNLPDRIKLFKAMIGDDITGVCTLFLVKDDVVLNFYLAADEEHKKDRVSDYLLYKTIEWSKQNRFRLYDIGTSNVGNMLLQGLFDFKKKFMADGYLRKTYSINI